MQESFIKAARIGKGSKIAVVSTSFPAIARFPKRCDRAIRSLESIFGFEVVLAPNANLDSGYIAGTAKERASDINWAFSEPSIDGIICAIGGNHTNQIISHLNYQLIQNNPKVLIGYSDVSILQLALLSIAKLITFYGPALIPEFGEYPRPFDYTINQFNKSVVNANLSLIEPASFYTDELIEWNDTEEIPLSRTIKPNAGFRIVRPGEAEGFLIACCLSSLVQILCWFPLIDFQDCILYIEPAPNRISEAERCMYDIANSGLFEKIAGLVIGRTCRFDIKESLKLDSIALETTRKKPIPIVSNVDFGHSDPQMTLPIGVRSRISAIDTPILEILEQGVLN